MTAYAAMLVVVHQVGLATIGDVVVAIAPTRFALKEALLIDASHVRLMSQATGLVAVAAVRDIVVEVYTCSVTRGDSRRTSRRALTIGADLSGFTLNAASTAVTRVRGRIHTLALTRAHRFRAGQYTLTVVADLTGGTLLVAAAAVVAVGFNISTGAATLCQIF